MELAEKISPHISNLFPEGAEIVDDGDRRLRISWRNPVEGRPNRRATPIAIYLDADLVEAVDAATDFEMASVVGPRFRNSLDTKMLDYNPEAGDLEAFVVYAGMESIGG